MKFSELSLEPSLLDALDAMGFEEATPVQEIAIPAILDGRDVLACAQTGTGKTAAFLLPMLNELTRDPDDGISALVLGPTRELVVQVDQQMEALSYFTGVSSIPIYGGRDGQSMSNEMKALKRGASVIIATPGRFTAHVDLGYVDFSNLRFLILDEADRMLDMGFAPAIMNIVNKLPVERQNLLFSATMPSKIRKFTQQILRDPVEISIAISKPAENILQAAYFVEDSSKIELIEHILEAKRSAERILIFVGTKKGTRELARALKRKNHDVAAVHSDLDQKDREEVVRNFKAGRVRVVVATDVLSRGIDISGIELVINYNVPSDAENYVHRIGRTARADASGMALTLINKPDRRLFKQIEELMDMEVIKTPLPKGIEPGFTEQRGRRGRSNNRYRNSNRGRNNRRRR